MRVRFPGGRIEEMGSPDLMSLGAGALQDVRVEVERPDPRDPSLAITSWVRGSLFSAPNVRVTGRVAAALDDS